MWKKIVKAAIFFIFAVVLNILGYCFAKKFCIPAYFTIPGTIIMAYIYGPVYGMATAITSGAVSAALFHDQSYYVFADIVIALFIGVIPKNIRFFKSLGQIIIMTTAASFIRGFAITLIDSLFLNGLTSFELSDAVVAQLHSTIKAGIIGVFIAALFIAFLDVLAANFFIYIGLSIITFLRKKRKAKQLKKALGGKISLGVIIGIVLFSPMFANDALAASDITFVEKIYNEENGLVGGYANDIDQTDDGIMWIATYGGLYRFDGRRFELTTDIESARSVQTIFKDDEGRLWLGSNGSGLTVYKDLKNYQTFNSRNGLPSDTIRDIIQDSNGVFYISTDAGIVVTSYDGAELKIIYILDEVGKTVRLASDFHNNVVAVDRNGKMWLMNEGRVQSSYVLSNCEIWSAEFDSKGILYAGTDDSRIEKFMIENGRFCAIGSISTGNFERINDLFFDESGIAYIAANNGVGYIAKDWSINEIESGSFNHSVENIFKDYQGNVWFASSRCGLMALEHSVFKDLFALCNKSEDVVNAVQKWNGQIYAGTDSGLVILDENRGVSVSNNLTDLFSGDRVRAIEAESSGSLLITGYQNGIVELKPDGTFENYMHENSSLFTDSHIRAIMQLSDNSIVVSDGNGLTFIKDHKFVRNLAFGKELKKGYILNFAEMEDGTLLAGTDGDGVLRIKNTEPRGYISTESGLYTGVILRITPNKRGGGCFVFTGSGICFLDDNMLVRKLDSIPYYNNYDMYMSDDAKLFILGGAGIYVVDYEDFILDNANIKYLNLDTRMGMPGSLTSNAWNYVDDDGIMYLAGNKGVYVLDTKNYNMGIKAYRANLSNVRFNKEEKIILSGEEIIIPRGTRHTELNIRVNNFTTTDPYVRYYMTGIDTHRTEVLQSELEPITYENIPFGNYEFHIEVLNNEGHEISEKIYNIHKEMELHETYGFKLYFYSMLLTIISFSVLSIIQLSLSSMSKKQSEEHNKVIAKLEREKAQAFERSLKSEEEANKAKSTFLATMSHEIRTPINAIIGMDTMILREATQDTIIKYARDIHSASRNLLSLINDILDFSKIESGNLELVLDEYSVSSVVNDLVNMIKPKADGKGLDLKLEINPNLPEGLYGDELRITQIIINIVNNAVKYTEKGSITFDLDYETVDEENILLKVHVKDTGIGIKEEDMANLFSPYKRIDEHHNKKIEGTGLGMSITKYLLDKMGSRLNVESVYGEGSDFSFSIMQKVTSFEPIGDYKARREEACDEAISTEKFHAPDAEVLITDDVEMNLIVAQSLLKRTKVKIETSLSGKEAVKMAVEKAYDIIFLDAMMPEMSGEETMRAIRAQSTINADTPIIVLTANAVKGAKEEYLRMGYTDYLSKPIDSAKLEALLQKYLPEEKIIAVDADVANAAGEIYDVEDTGKSDIELIGMIDGINTEEGIKAVGSADTYEVICHNFYDTAESRIEMLRSAYEARDIENYTIQVHALKSSARIIGALELSEHAFQLEMAGKESDIQKIESETDDLLEKYEHLYYEFGKIFGSDIEKADDESKPLMDTDELRTNLSDMKELLMALDFDTAEEMFNFFAEYRLPDDFTDHYTKIKAALSQLNADAAAAQIDEYLNK